MVGEETVPFSTKWRCLQPWVELHVDRRGLSTVEYGVLFVLQLAATLLVWKKLAAGLDAKVSNGIDLFAHASEETRPSYASNATTHVGLNPAPSPANNFGSVASASNGWASVTGSSTLFEPPALQKKHITTVKPDADDGGTYDLWRTCQDGVTQACTALEQTNAAQLKEVVSFIQRVAPDLYDPQNPPKFQWDSSDDFFNNNDGATKDATITLARGYYGERQLVNTVAHELQHAQQSRTDVWLTWGQDKASEILGDGSLGSKHQAIANRASDIEARWVEVHP